MHNASTIPPAQALVRLTTDGWSLNAILDQGMRFLPVPRIACSSLSLANQIKKFESNGIPLIVEGFHTQPKWLRKEFSPEWLLAHCPQEIDVRNVHDWSDKTMSLTDFMTQSRASPRFAPLEEKERLYGKDAACPDAWSDWLCRKGVIPFPLAPNHPDNLLLSHVETLMCYLGIGDTFTPCHKDLCASSGHNLMCYTEKGGSSFWFMTKSSDAASVSQYFQNLNQEVDHETHIITIEQLAEAPFNVYIAEQRLGDLVLVPPRSCHQVVNYGGMTIKMSWSRMTLQGLVVAYYHELPIYRRVCREETYRIKSTIYNALCQKSGELARMRPRSIHSRSTLPDDERDLVVSTMKVLLSLFDDVLLDEYSPTHGSMYCLSTSSPRLTPSDSRELRSDENIQLRCDFCGADIFQSLFECLNCVPFQSPAGSRTDHGDGFIICPGCYVEGRSCRCGEMEPIQCRPLEKLTSKRDKAAELLHAHTHTPISSLDLDYSELNCGTGTFYAACLLHQARQKQGRKRNCASDPPPETNHLVPFFSGLSCKMCNKTECFLHTLTLGKIHASDALLINSIDSSNEEYHHHHRTSNHRYDEGRETFLQCQKSGTKPDLSQQRVHIALQYSTCKPIISSAFISLGWYDTHAQLLPSTGDIQQNLVAVAVPAPKPWSGSHSTGRHTTLAQTATISSRNTTLPKRRRAQVDSSETSDSTSEVNRPSRRTRGR